MKAPLSYFCGGVSPCRWLRSGSIHRCVHERRKCVHENRKGRCKCCCARRGGGRACAFVMGYGVNLGANWFAGLHGFAGYMGGSASYGDSSDAGSKGKLVISPGLDAGVWAQMGGVFGANRLFATVGWTAAKITARANPPQSAMAKVIESASWDKPKWGSGLSAGAGYDRMLSEDVRVGVGYTATFLGTTVRNDWKGAEFVMRTRLVNQTVSVGVTYVIPSQS